MHVRGCARATLIKWRISEGQVRAKLETIGLFTAKLAYRSGLGLRDLSRLT